MAKKMTDNAMTIEDLAPYMNRSTSTLYKLCAAGKVSGTNAGGHRRFHKFAIDRWLCCLCHMRDRCRHVTSPFMLAAGIPNVKFVSVAGLLTT